MNSALLKKIILLGVGLALVLIFVSFDLGQFLTLEYLKASQSRFQALYNSRPLLVIAVYLGGEFHGA